MADPVTPAPAAAAVPPAPATPAPQPAPVFADQLPEDIRTHAAFKDIKDLGSLAKSYLHAQQMIGVPADQVLKLPTTDDPAAWSDVWAKLGRPDSPDKYQLTTPPGLQDAGLRDWFAKTAHEAGLNAKQAKGLFDGYLQLSQTVAQQQAQKTEQAQQQQIASLRTEWGAAFEQKVNEARAALQHYGDGELIQYLDETRLGNDPRMLKVFAKLGAQLREDGVIGRATGGQSYAPTEAKQQINALRGDPAFAKAYADARHPGHVDAVARMEKLYQQAYPAS